MKINDSLDPHDQPPEGDPSSFEKGASHESGRMGLRRDPGAAPVVLAGAAALSQVTEGDPSARGLADEAVRLLAHLEDGDWQAAMSTDDGRHRIERVTWPPRQHQVGLVGRWSEAQFIAAAPRLVRCLLSRAAELDQQLTAALQAQERLTRERDDYKRAWQHALKLVETVEGERASLESSADVRCHCGHTREQHSMGGHSEALQVRPYCVFGCPCKDFEPDRRGLADEMRRHATGYAATSGGQLVLKWAKVVAQLEAERDAARSDRDRFQRQRNEAEAERDTLQEQLSALTVELERFAHLDSRGPDGRRYSFAALCDSIDSKDLEGQVYDLVIWHIRRAEKAEAEAAAVRVLINLYREATGMTWSRQLTAEEIALLAERPGRAASSCLPYPA